nr:MAG TPA: hypothetical protein [Caudoviricetes sp.]
MVYINLFKLDTNVGFTSNLKKITLGRIAEPCSRYSYTFSSLLKI